jgi:hypothetical protein
MERGVGEVPTRGDREGEPWGGEAGGGGGFLEGDAVEDGDGGRRRAWPLSPEVILEEEAVRITGVDGIAAAGDGGSKPYAAVEIGGSIVKKIDIVVFPQRHMR